MIKQKNFLRDILRENFFEFLKISEKKLFFLYKFEIIMNLQVRLQFHKKISNDKNNVN